MKKLIAAMAVLPIILIFTQMNSAFQMFQGVLCPTTQLSKRT